MKPSPSLLDPHETNPQLTTEVTPWGSTITADDPEVIWRHSGWQRERNLLRASLERTGASHRSLNRWDLCGCDPWVARDPDQPDRLTILVNTCRNRWCLPCSQTRGARVQHHLSSKLAQTRCRFLTLTLRPRPQSLALELTRLLDSFARLRRTKLWTNAVNGGASVLEVHHSRTGDHWHPHLHVVCHGRYLPQAALSQLWHRITGDSYIVHVTLARSGADAARYLAKYLRKPTSNTVINRPPLLDELVRSLRGRRMLTTFGDWRGYRLTAPIDDTKWESLCPLSALIERAVHGDADARRDLATLYDSHPAIVTLLNHHPP